MTDTINSALIRWEGFAGLPAFDRITEGDFTAAFDWAMDDHNREIDAIATDADAPDFANTVDALEVSGDALSRVSAVFFTRAGADTNPEIQKIEREIVPKLSSHYSAIGANKALFQRIDTLWQARDGLGLTGEQLRVLELVGLVHARDRCRVEAGAGQHGRKPRGAPLSPRREA